MLSRELGVIAIRKYLVNYRGLFEMVQGAKDTQINRVGKHKVVNFGDAKDKDADVFFDSLGSTYRLGAVRASFGLSTNFADIERLVACLAKFLDIGFQKSFLEDCVSGV
jgi:selenocysteine lyase/cysteine desulfurase